MSWKEHDRDSNGGRISISALVKTLQEGIDGISSSDDDDNDDVGNNARLMNGTRMRRSSISDMVHSLVAQYQNTSDDDDDSSHGKMEEDGDDDDGLRSLVQKVKQQYEGLERVSVQATTTSTSSRKSNFRTASASAQRHDVTSTSSLRISSKTNQQQQRSTSSVISNVTEILDSFSNVGDDDDHYYQRESTVHSATMHDTIHSTTLRMLPSTVFSSKQQQQQQREMQQDSAESSDHSLVSQEQDEGNSTTSESSFDLNDLERALSSSHSPHPPRRRGDRRSGTSWSMTGAGAGFGGTDTSSQSFHDSALDLALEDLENSQHLNFLSSDGSRDTISADLGLSATFRSDDLDRALLDDDDDDTAMRMMMDEDDTVDDDILDDESCSSDGKKGTSTVHQPTRIFETATSSPTVSNNALTRIIQVSPPLKKNNNMAKRRSATILKPPPQPTRPVPRPSPPRRRRSIIMNNIAATKKNPKMDKRSATILQLPPQSNNRPPVSSPPPPSPHHHHDHHSKLAIHGETGKKNSRLGSMTTSKHHGEVSTSGRDSSPSLPLRVSKTKKKKSPGIRDTPRKTSRHSMMVSPAKVQSPKGRKKTSTTDAGTAKEEAAAETTRKQFSPEEKRNRILSHGEIPKLSKHGTEEEEEVPPINNNLRVGSPRNQKRPGGQKSARGDAVSPQHRKSNKASSSNNQSPRKRKVVDNNKSGKLKQGTNHTKKSPLKQSNKSPGVRSSSSQSRNKRSDANGKQDSERNKFIDNKSSSLQGNSSLVIVQSPPPFQNRNAPTEKEDLQKVPSLMMMMVEESSWDDSKVPLEGPIRVISFSKDVDPSRMDEDTSISSSSSDEDDYETESEGTSTSSSRGDESVLEASSSETEESTHDQQDISNKIAKKSHRSSQSEKVEVDDAYETDDETNQRKVGKKMAAVFQQMTKGTSNDEEYETDEKRRKIIPTRLSKSHFAVRDHEHDFQTRTRRNKIIEAIDRQISFDSYESDSDDDDYVTDTSMKKKMNAVVRQIPSRSYESDSDSTYSRETSHHHRPVHQKRPAPLSTASSSVEYTDDEDDDESSSQSDSDGPIITPAAFFPPEAENDDDSTDEYEFDDEYFVVIDSSDHSSDSNSSAQFTDASTTMQNDREYYQKLDRITRREDELAIRNERIKRKFYVISAVLFVLGLGLTLLFSVKPLKEGFISRGNGRRRLRGRLKHS